MSITYSTFINAFLQKINEYDMSVFAEHERYETLIEYMKRSISGFKKNCKYDLVSACDDENRTFSVDIDSDDLDEIVDIVTEGMVVQWLKPYVYKQELLENAINTRDFTTYSPATLLMRVGNAYAKAQRDYVQMIREYSYNHGDLSDLHI